MLLGCQRRTEEYPLEKMPGGPLWPQSNFRNSGRKPHGRAEERGREGRQLSGNLAAK